MDDSFANDFCAGLIWELRADGLRIFADWLEGSLQFQRPEDDSLPEAERREIMHLMRACAASWKEGVPYG